MHARTQTDGQTDRQTDRHTHTHTAHGMQPRWKCSSTKVSAESLNVRPGPLDAWKTCRQFMSVLTSDETRTAHARLQRSRRAKSANRVFACLRHLRRQRRYNSCTHEDALSTPRQQCLEQGRPRLHPHSTHTATSISRKVSAKPPSLSLPSIGRWPHDAA